MRLSLVVGVPAAVAAALQLQWPGALLGMVIVVVPMLVLRWVLDSKARSDRLEKMIRAVRAGRREDPE